MVERSRSRSGGFILGPSIPYEQYMVYFNPKMKINNDPISGDTIEYMRANGLGFERVTFALTILTSFTS